MPVNNEEITTELPAISPRIKHAGSLATNLSLMVAIMGLLSAVDTPLTYIKNQIQTQADPANIKRSSALVISQACKGLTIDNFKGSSGPFTGFYTTFEGYLLRLYRPLLNTTLASLQEIIASKDVISPTWLEILRLSVFSVVDSAVVTSLENLRTYQQTLTPAQQAAAKNISTITQMQQLGIPRLYKCFPLLTLRQFINNAFLFSALPVAKKITGQFELSPIEIIMANVTAATLYAASIMPLDRACILGTKAEDTKTSMDALLMVKNEGPKVAMAGFRWKLGPMIANMLAFNGIYGLQRRAEEDIKNLRMLGAQDSTPELR